MIKKLLPKTLFSRFLLIIITPVIILQALSIYMFYERHWDRVTRRFAHNVSMDVAHGLYLLQEHPEFLNNLKSLPGYRYLDIDIDYYPDQKYEKESTSHTIAQILNSELSQTLSLPFSVQKSYFTEEFYVLTPYQDGLLQFSVREKRLFSSTTYIFIMWILGMSMVLFAIAIMFMRNQIRPIRKLSQAADVLGKGGNIDTLKVSGASEIRQAALAFKRMRDRINRFVQQRTDMLSGVSHDLRTPLTRMRLQLSLMKDVQGVDNLNKDVDEMEQMVQAYLNFARGEGNEKPTKTNITRLIQGIIEKIKREGHKVHMNDNTGIVKTRVMPLALTRALNNVISNAVRYGDSVMVSASEKDGNLVIHVDDDGPGIPKDQHENVFRPFLRLEESRNQETGGVGLGLPIARDSVRTHGGEIELSKSAMGGLRVTIIIPRQDI